MELLQSSFARRAFAFTFVFVPHSPRLYTNQHGPSPRPLQERG